MNQDNVPSTMDPVDWNRFESVFNRAISGISRRVAGLRDRAVWTPPGDDLARRFEQPVPDDPADLEDLVDEFEQEIARSTYGNDHPRFWGWVVGNGTPAGLLGETLAGSMNVNAAFGANSAIWAELQVLSWFKERLGFPEAASGVMVTGGSVANLVGLAVGLRHQLGEGYAREGLSAIGSRPRVYASSEVHNSVDKAVRVLGLGTDNLVKVPVDSRFRMDVAALREAIEADSLAGLRPAIVVATAGTVNTGATDPLRAVAEICRNAGLWLHVDGAFGSLAALSERYGSRVDGLEEADSLAFDLHKWLHAQYDSGCVLVRDRDAHRRTFAVDGAYLKRVEGNLADGPEDFTQLGLELSRGARGLRAWFHLRAHGFKALTASIERNIDQATALAETIEKSDEFELMAPVTLNVVCFRYNPRKTVAGNRNLDELNKSILVRLHRSGVAAPSHTIINGMFCLRVAITNHRSRPEDFERLLGEIRMIAKESVAA